MTVTRVDSDETETQSISASETIRSWDKCIERLRRTPCPMGLEEGGENEALVLDVIEQCHEIVKIARAIRNLVTEDRRRRKDTEPQPRTVHDYEKKCRQIDLEIDALPEDEPERLMSVMAVHAVKARSFTAIKSALKWRSLQQLDYLLKRQAAEQRNSGKSHAWVGQVVQLYRAITRFIEVNDLNRQVCLDFMGVAAKKGRSKRADLPFLPEGWQDRFRLITEGDQKFADVGVLLLHCGLRPVELAKGVQVSSTSQGIEVEIKGGKVRNTAGQPVRNFVLDPGALPLPFVQRVVKQGTVNISAKPDALRAYLNRLSDQVFLQGDFRPKGTHQRRYVLSAYTFRHALVTSLREDGWTSEAIAAVIGESSAETVSYYGIRTRKGANPGRKASVIKDSQKTARPVRGIDMQGLDKVKNRRKRTVSMTPPM